MSVPGVLDLITGTNPGYNPTAGRLLLWPNSADGHWYARDSAGVDTLLAGITSLTAADTSIVIGGTGSAPTVATNTLDVIATQHPPVANWSNNSKKITALANGSAAQDAAAFGQVPILTAADTSVVVAGTASAPTVATNTVDVIATQHPPAAAWSNNSKKITSLANGSGAQDAAAFGQIPTSLPPNGAAGGGLQGTYPNPTVLTNANLTGGVTSVGNAATVVTNANLTGPVTSVGNATTIVGPVTNAMLATEVQQTVKGRAVGAGTGTPVDLTSAQVAALIDPASSTLQGAMSAVQFKKLATVTDFVNDLGCDPTGAVDATAIVQAWHDALTTPAIGFVPPNANIRLASNVNLTKNDIRILGANRRTSGFLATAATPNMFTVSGDSVIFENIRFQATGAATRTAGFAVEFQSTADSSGCIRCDAVFMWSCFRSSGPLHFFDDVTCREYGANAINGACILIEGTGDRYIRRLLTDSTPPSAGHAGVRVNECASLVVSDSNIIHAGNAMELTPTSTKTVASVEVVNTFFDTSVNGLVINGTAANGSIYRSKFTGCWFGSHSTNGVTMNGIAGGLSQFDGISFSHCEFFGNVIGISCPLGGGSWSVSDSRIAGNTGSGISVTAGTNHEFDVHDCEIGPVASFGVNGTGIIIGAGAYERIAIHDNDLGANTTTLTDSGPATATAGKWISRNIGLAMEPARAVANQLPTAATETIITGTLVTVPANGFLIGTTIEFEARGILSGTTPSILAKIRAGANGVTPASDTQVCTTIAAVMTTATGWKVTGTVSIRTLGAGGSCIGNVDTFGDNLATANRLSAQSTTVAIDTTSTKFVYLTLTSGGTTPVLTVTNARARVVQQ